MNNKKAAQDEKITILYQRLSREDGDKTESESIANQRSLLEEYAEKNGFKPYISVVDDGYSGTNWNRPGWQNIIEMVNDDKVENLLVKDSTRIGRDYLRAGLYREMFRDKGVRLICVSEGLDSANGEDDFTPFREIMAEYYARDTSRKIKSVIHKKGRDGKPLGTIPLYGYKKDPNDKHTRIIDEEAAAIVRRIFQMTIEGIGPYCIARKLMEEKVERPSYYLYRTGIISSPGKCNLNLQYNWRGNTVETILRKQEYMGDLVNFKTVKPSFKSKKQVPVPPEEQLVFKDAMPAIVDRETWELAQKLRKTVRRVSKGEYQSNPLTGILFCSDCGGKLHNRRSHYTEDKNGNKVYPVDTYECLNYRKNAEKFVDECSIHFIRSSVVRELILDTIRSISNYAKNNEKEFIEKLREASTVKQADTVKSHKKQLIKYEKRIAELEILFRKVYEDNAMGKLSDERYQEMSKAYELEQNNLKVQSATIKAELEAFEHNSLRVDNFMELIHKYTAFEELTTPMLHEFVDKVVVHEADRSTGERVQQVDIYLNFIGNFIIPGSEPIPLTPEEEEAEKERLAKKIKKNENLRQWRAKKRAKELAQRAEENAKSN